MLTKHSVQNILQLGPLGSKTTYIPPRNELLELAAEGLAIRAALDDWYIDFQKYIAEFEGISQSTESVLAMAYFYGISIYLSGIFDYHTTQFDDILTPAISQTAIQDHVSMVLMTTTVGLETTSLSPVLFFFPLRVAGSRAMSANQRELILGLLEQVSRRSFPVAEAFIEDLKAWWEWKYLQSLKEM